VASSASGDMAGFLSGDALETLKDSRGSRPKNEAPNVSHISDATGIDIGHGADLTKKLNEKPEPDQKHRGNKGNTGEPAKQKYCLYLITG